MRNVLSIAGLAAALIAPGFVPVSAQSRPDFSGVWVVESVQQPERPQMGGPGGGSPGGGMGRGGGMMGGGRRGGGGGMGGGQRPQGDGPRGDRPGGAFALPQKGQQFTLVQTDERLDVTTLVQGIEQTRSYIFGGSDASASAASAAGGAGSSETAGGNGSNGAGTNGAGTSGAGTNGLNRPIARTTWEGVALVTETTITMPARNNDGDDRGGNRDNGDGNMTRTLREVRSINPDGKMVVMTTMKTPRGTMASTVTLARAPQ